MTSYFDSFLVAYACTCLIIVISFTAFTLLCLSILFPFQIPVRFYFFCIQEEVIVDGSVVRSGRNFTVVAVEFKLKKTGRLIYTARATFYNMPIAKL
jgi:hypothetical protein